MNNGNPQMRGNPTLGQWTVLVILFALTIALLFWLGLLPAELD